MVTGHPEFIHDLAPFLHPKVTNFIVEMWSVLCTDFDPEEETANFGVTRAALQSRGGELYDVVTFATLEPKVIFLLPLLHSL